MKKVLFYGFVRFLFADIDNCDCTGIGDLDVVSGQIWPAWGQVVENDDGTTMITPPANCTGTTCGRANVTCSIGKKMSENVEWSWSWVPKVQYPRGDKSREPDVLEMLPTFESVQKITGFDDCPTFYYEYFGNENSSESIKTCPQTYNTATQSTSVLIIYNYINEQDDGDYICYANVVSSSRNRKTLDTPTCCNQTVYYASPKWNGWCWTGMIYSIGFTALFLYFLATNILDSPGEKRLR